MYPPFQLRVFWQNDFPLGAVHILRNTGWGGGSSQFITILHRGEGSTGITYLMDGP